MYDKPVFHDQTTYVCGKCGLLFDTRYPPQDPLYGPMCGACDADEQVLDELFMQACGGMGRKWDEDPGEC